MAGVSCIYHMATLLAERFSTLAEKNGFPSTPFHFVCLLNNLKRGKLDNYTLLHLVCATRNLNQKLFWKYLSFGFSRLLFILYFIWSKCFKNKSTAFSVLIRNLPPDITRLFFFSLFKMSIQMFNFLPEKLKTSYCEVLLYIIWFCSAFAALKYSFFNYWLKLFLSGI